MLGRRRDLDEADDYPQTHLDDEAYDEFVGREFDSKGRLKGGPPVGVWIVILVGVLLALALVILR